MYWKKAYKQLLIQNYQSLKLLHQKNNQPFYLHFPEKLESNKELLEFSKQINSHIGFPELHFFRNKN